MNQAFYEIGKISNFFSPKKIILGQNTVRNVGEEARLLNGTKALIVTDKGIVSAGYAQIVEDALRAANRTSSYGSLPKGSW